MAHEDYAGHPSGGHLPSAIDHLHLAQQEHPTPEGKLAISKALQALLAQQASDMAAHKAGQNPVVSAALR